MYAHKSCKTNSNYTRRCCDVFSELFIYFYITIEYTYKLCVVVDLKMSIKQVTLLLLRRVVLLKNYFFVQFERISHLTDFQSKVANERTKRTTLHHRPR